MQHDSNALFEPQYDVIPLPSGGLFYKNKKSTVKVSYLTAADENVLTSPNLLENGKVIDVLLERKVIDKDLRPNEMLSGDKNAIVFFLRSTGYGEKYPIELKDPKDGEVFQTEIDISAFKAKEIKISPDENGECEYTLPKSGKNLKFRYLTSEEDERLIKEDDNRKKRNGDGISQILTQRLIAQIMEVEGVREKIQIKNFVEYMHPMDANSLRNYITDNEPGLDLQIEVEAPSGEFFFGELPVTTKFLWPYLDV